MTSAPDSGRHRVDVDGLAAAFVTVARRAGASLDVEPTVADLLARWGSANRHYHDLLHLQEVLARIHDLTEHTEHTEHLDEVLLAAWFHDAVHEARPGHDERASAALAHDGLSALGLPADAVDRVVALVLSTAVHHGDDVPPALRADAGVLNDADLAILASTPERYRQYADAVRAEYAHVDDATFRAGRAAVLQGLLERPTLFTTPAAQRLWERQARAAVSAEIADLTGPST